MATIRQSVNEQIVTIEATVDDVPVRMVEFNIQHPDPVDVTSIYDSFDRVVTPKSSPIPQISSGQKWLFHPDPLYGKVTVIVRVAEEQILRQPPTWGTGEPPVIAIRGPWADALVRRFLGTVVNQRIEIGTYDRTFTFLIQEELLEET